METFQGDMGFKSQQEEDQWLKKIARRKKKELIKSHKSLDTLLGLIMRFNMVPHTLKLFEMKEILNHFFVRHVIISRIAHLPSHEKYSIHDLPIGSHSLVLHPDPFLGRLERMQLIMDSGIKKWKHTDNINLIDVKFAEAKKTGPSPFIHDVELIL